MTDLLDDIYYSYGGGYAGHSLVGQSLGSWMGFKTDGVFHTQAEVDEYCRKYTVEFGRPAVGCIKYQGAVFDNGEEYYPIPVAQYNFSLGRYTQNPGYPAF